MSVLIWCTHVALLLSTPSAFSLSESASASDWYCSIMYTEHVGISAGTSTRPTAQVPLTYRNMSFLHVTTEWVSQRWVWLQWGLVSVRTCMLVVYVHVCAFCIGWWWKGIHTYMHVLNVIWSSCCVLYWQHYTSMHSCMGNGTVTCMWWIINIIKQYGVWISIGLGLGLYRLVV